MKVVIDDCRLERMDAYTEPLEAKIKRQAAEITRLLADNAELKKGREAIRDNAFEAGLIRGQEEAWELAQKIILPQSRGGMNDEDYKGVFGSSLVDGVIANHTYSEAAAKVAEWERKNEICVGDVVLCEGIHGLVFGVGEVYIKGITPGCTPFQWHKQNCKKTGRHIDVSSMLSQIGGGSDE